MKDLGKTRILGTISMKIDWVDNMVVPEYIDEILNEVQYGKRWESFLSHGRGWSKIQMFWHLMSKTTWMNWSIMYTMICTYSDMSYALNVMSIYQNDS